MPAQICYDLHFLLVIIIFTVFITADSLLNRYNAKGGLGKVELLCMTATQCNVRS